MQSITIQYSVEFVAFAGIIALIFLWGLIRDYMRKHELWHYLNQDSDSEDAYTQLLGYQLEDLKGDNE